MLTWIRGGWLNGVANFSFHKHLPHYAITTEDRSATKVLATQPIAHVETSTKRGSEILLADSTMFSTLFGADDSLKRFRTKPGHGQMSRQMFFEARTASSRIAPSAMRGVLRRNGREGAAAALSVGRPIRVAFLVVGMDFDRRSV